MPMYMAFLFSSSSALHSQITNVLIDYDRLASPPAAFVSASFPSPLSALATDSVGTAGSKRGKAWFSRARRGSRRRLGSRGASK